MLQKILLGCLLALVTPLAALATEDTRAEQVRAAETAFAATMANRDVDAFARFIDAEAVFIGAAGEVRGRDAVVKDWRKYFADAKAPFSWRPQTVAVLASGTLALSSGPVFDPAGKRIGTFNSTWRLDEDGRWRVIFDNGCPACECGR